MVRDFIKTLTNKKTIILTTHNMDEADRLADRVAIIDHGKLLLLDTPENLKKSIGEGDILEIELDLGITINFEKLIEKLRNICDTVSISGAKLIITSKELIKKVAQITDAITEEGYIIKEMSMRENTLEDVFIHLTGRTLRQ
jgi:ABC-2 type transport system ATP-binding protein